jgi:hypothetical protein
MLSKRQKRGEQMTAGQLLSDLIRARIRANELEQDLSDAINLL